MEGFHEAVRGVVEVLAEAGLRSSNLNVFPGFLSTEDLRRLKEVLSDFGIDYTLLPDYSETLDGESWSEYQKLSAGGTGIQAIRDMGRACASIQFGRSLIGQSSAAAYLQERFDVPAVTLNTPIGIRQTDLFFKSLVELMGRSVPHKYERERGRLVDAYIDGHKYVSGKRAVVFGEADFVAAMASFLDEIGIVPALCATGAATGRFRETVMAGIENGHECPLVAEDTDFVTMLDACKTIGVDIVIGSSKGYFLSRKLGVPMVRVGFPIHDRIGGQRVLHIGYRGAQQLFDRVVNALIEAQQNSSSVGYSYI